MKRLCFVIFIFYTFITTGFTQFYRSYENWNIGFNVGINNFMGDVSNVKNKIFISDPFTKDFYQNRYPMAQISLGKEFTPFWNLKINVLYGNIRSESNDLDLKFTSYYTHDISLLNSINVFGFENNPSFENWQLNLHLGIGLFSYKTVLKNTETNVLEQEIPSSFNYSFSIPFGIGVAYYLNDDWKLNFDIMYRWIASDNLDALKTTNKRFEGFSYSSIGISYSFNTLSLHQPKKFKLHRNYTFNALGSDKVHQQYRHRKRLGNTHRISNSTTRENIRHYQMNKRKRQTINQRISK